MSHVFISYAREDEHWAALLQQNLKQSGFEVWMPHPDLRHYLKEWREHVGQAIKDAFAVIVIITSNADNSTYLEQEWELAERLSKPVIPVIFGHSEKYMERYPALPPLDFSHPAEYPWRLLARTLIRAAQGTGLPVKPVTREAVGLFEAEDTKKVEPTQTFDIRSLREAKDEEPASDAPVAAPPAEAEETAAPPEIAPEEESEVVRFTAFGPKEAIVENWYTLLVYAHTDEALARVRADAARHESEMGGMPREVRAAKPTRLARGAEITMQPTCDGVIFNPERITLRWYEPMHRAEFRFKADNTLTGAAGNLLISILVGPVIVATMRLGVLFDDLATASFIGTSTIDEPAAVTADLYRAEQIFISYSHADTPVVAACRNAYKALGYDVLIDIDTLRAGQTWNDELMRMIERATVFQLFWSARSAASQYVKQEWEYALQQARTKGGAFIRPVYWEDPLTKPPEALSHLHFDYVVLPRLDTGAISE